MNYFITVYLPVYMSSKTIFEQKRHIFVFLAEQKRFKQRFKTFFKPGETQSNSTGDWFSEQEKPVTKQNSIKFSTKF